VLKFNKDKMNKENKITLESVRDKILRDVLMDETDCVTIEEARKDLSKKWPKS